MKKIFLALLRFLSHLIALKISLIYSLALGIEDRLPVLGLYTDPTIIYSFWLRYTLAKILSKVWGIKIDNFFSSSYSKVSFIMIPTPPHY